MSIFNKIKLARPKRSTFDLSHESKWTSEFGLLMPTYWTYIEPGAEIRAKSEIMCRVMAMLAPIMHRVNIYNWWYACPIRILMLEEDFQNFFTGGVSGDVEVAWPKYRVFGDAVQNLGWDPLQMRLLDMLDFPTRYGTPAIDTNIDNFTIDAMPLRAYAKIWNDWHRDPNTSAEVDLDMFVGEQDISDTDLDLFSLKRKTWDKDYFTTALPNAQRGGDMNMPFDAISELSFNGESKFSTLFDGTAAASTDPTFKGDASNNKVYATNGVGDVKFDVTGHTDVNTRILGTINQFREALSIQRWRERMAVGGSRYIEQIYSMFGVKGDDARLQRPIFLGGSRVPLQISEVLQTSESTDTSVQGIPAGRGFALDRQGFVKFFAKEHCIVMNISCIVPKPAYFQGMPRKCNIRDRYDFPWPILGHLGEQPVLNEEIYFNPSNINNNDGTFGYQSRYAQYKFEFNKVHGEFRNTLDFWHLARKFGNLPTLSRQFQEINSSANDLDRVFATASDSDLYGSVTDHFWVQQAFDIKVKRPLPYFATPNI